MSIFKDTLKQYVQDQLKAREIIVSQWGDTGDKDSKGNPIYNTGVVPRDNVFLRYTNGKNSFVKMSSFVNFNGKVGKATYSGSQLARKYILEGGTLHEPLTNQYTLREGVSRRDGVYASDIDLGGDRPLGLRPMPGITSVSVTNKSAYGSLREATVKFYCWDKHQLEELEILFMRTGYSVLLEWGWSQYLQSGKVIKQDGKPDTYTNTLDNITIQNFDYPTIDIFYDDKILNPKGAVTSDELIYDAIEDITKRSNGNYDAMLGHIKNFSWQLMDNGGFDCSTVLVSRGEIISTLKLSSNNTAIVLNDANDPNATSPPLSEFESIFLNYSALINDSELTALWSADNSKLGQFSSGSSFITSATKDKLKNDINTKLGLNGKASNSRVPLFTDTGDGDLFNQQMYLELLKYYGVTLLTAGQEDGVGIEYIKMDHFIALLNFYFNYKDKGNRIISNILIPKDNLCLASTDSVSVDPTTCIIFNSKATEIVALNPNGFSPQAFTSVTSTNSQDVIPVEIKDPPQFLVGSGKTVRGKISNIYIAIPKILEIFRNTAKNGDVNLIDFFKSLLNSISVALGNINDFSFHSTKSSAQIIDIKYLEQGQGDKKFVFDLLGLKSICRDVKITSRIFESQASMIAISAQSKSNIGDLYTSTQVYFNRGLTDRILPEKDIYKNKDNIDEENFYLSIYKNIISIANYLKVKVIGSNINIGGGTVDRVGIIYPSSNEISNASSLLKTFHYQLRGDETAFKAIIPIELELTLDGIAGLVQGQIFKVNGNILPSMYNQRNLGFIVTGLSHSLQRNDWTTSVKTQVCLLDNETIDPNVKGPDFDKIRSIIQKLIIQGKTNQYLIIAIADWIAFNILSGTVGDESFGGIPRVAEYFNYIPGTSFALQENYQRNYIARTFFPGPKIAARAYAQNFTEFLDYWYGAINVSARKKDPNFPKSVSEITSFVDSSTGGIVEFDPTLVDSLLVNIQVAQQAKQDPEFKKFLSLQDDNNTPLYYLYGIGGRALDYNTNLNTQVTLTTSVNRLPETNILINPNNSNMFPDLDHVLLAFSRLFAWKVDPTPHSPYTENEYKADINILKSKNLITVDNTYNTFNINSKGISIGYGQQVFNYILDSLVKNIFSNTNPAMNPLFYANISALTDNLKIIDLVTTDIGSFNKGGGAGISAKVAGPL